MTTFMRLTVLSLVGVFLCGIVLADESNLDVSKILAVVPVKSGSMDNRVYSQFDKLVPELKKISKSKIIKLQCRYTGQPSREQDVLNAYKIATHIERYLRVRHKLDLDLWVAIDIAQKTVKTPPVLTIAIFSDDIKKLDAEQIDPPKNDQQ